MSQHKRMPKEQALNILRALGVSEREAEEHYKKHDETIRLGEELYRYEREIMGIDDMQQAILVAAHNLLVLLKEGRRELDPAHYAMIHALLSSGIGAAR